MYVLYLALWFEKFSIGFAIYLNRRSASMNRSTASEIVRGIINPLCATAFIDIVCLLYQDFIKKSECLNICDEQLLEKCVKGHNWYLI